MSKAGLLAFCLALATSPAAAVELTYHFEGEIVAARTRSRPTSPFDPLLGRTFTGSFTFDSDDVDTFSPGRSNFYPATRSRFTIDDANFVEFMSFGAPPLIVADNGLFLSADTSETPGHEAVWDFENVDVGESFAGVHLSFFESDVPEAIIEKLNDGTLTENFFTEEGSGASCGT